MSPPSVNRNPVPRSEAAGYLPSYLLCYAFAFLEAMAAAFPGGYIYASWKRCLCFLGSYASVSMDAMPKEICSMEGLICVGASWISLVSFSMTAMPMLQPAWWILES